MIKLLSSLILLSLFTTAFAENNTSTDSAKIIEKQVKEQMEKEKKYAKEQRFYQGDEYNLSEAEVNEESLSSIKAIEPDYDFDITDVYRDDL